MLLEFLIKLPKIILFFRHCFVPSCHGPFRPTLTPVTLIKFSNRFIIDSNGSRVRPIQHRYYFHPLILLLKIHQRNKWILPFQTMKIHGFNSCFKFGPVNIKHHLQSSAWNQSSAAFLAILADSEINFTSETVGGWCAQKETKRDSTFVCRTKYKIFLPWTSEEQLFNFAFSAKKKKHLLETTGYFISLF